MPFKFEQLDVWQMALDYVDLMYVLAEKLPGSENFNRPLAKVGGKNELSANLRQSARISWRLARIRVD